MARILSLCSRVPYPLTGGAKLRMFYTAHELKVDHEVELLIVDERPIDESAVDPLRRTFDAVHVLTYPSYRFYLNAALGVPSRRPLQTHYYYFSEVQNWLDANDQRFDLLFCNHVRTTEYVRNCDIPRVVDLVDAISRNYREAIKDADGLWRAIYPIEWRRLWRYERGVVRSFDRSFIITEEDRDFVVDGEAFPSLSVLPNGVKPELLKRDPAQYRSISTGPTIAFLGKMDYFPNEDAVEYFSHRTFPEIRTAYPDAKFLIVGASPSERVRRLEALPGITVTGFVDDPYEFLLQSDLIVAPMRHGAGLQNKVLEALALGCPVLASPLAREGIAANDGEHLAVAVNSESFADEAISLLSDVERRRTIGSAGRELVRSQYTWKIIGERLRDVISSVLDERRA